MEFIRSSLLQILFLMLVVSFIIFYPMMVSIYVFMPLLIGFFGYMLLTGIYQNKFFYILVSFVYLLNLELNLSLPIFMSIISILVVYLLFVYFKIFLLKCNICKSVIGIVLVDLVYFGFILLYDFIFQTTSIVIDELLLYSFVVDLIMVIVL